MAIQNDRGRDTNGALPTFECVDGHPPEREGANRSDGLACRSTRTTLPTNSIFKASLISSPRPRQSKQHSAENENIGVEAVMVKSIQGD